jgi:mitogen-activated protein kinase kinase kinase
MIGFWIAYDRAIVSFCGSLGNDSVLIFELALTHILRYSVLTQRFSNSAEYSLEDVSIEHFIAVLVATDHFLVYTQSFEEDGTYIIASSILRDRPATIRRLLTEAFHVNEVVTDEGIRVASNDFLEEDYDYDVGRYLLLLSPRSGFLWNGLVLMLDIPKIELDMKDNRVRLVADGPQRRLALAKQCFDEIFVDDEEGEPLYPDLRRLPCHAEQQAHLPSVQRELRKIARATNRLAETIVDSVHHVRDTLGAISGSQDLLENWYVFASEHGQHAQKYMERSALHKFNQLLIGLAISWVSFICDDCDPSDRNTFKWAVNALEFTFQRIQRNNILHLPDDEFEMLRQKVANCMTLLISHFDILGARGTVEEKREKERQEVLLRQAVDDGLNDEFSKPVLPAQEEAVLNLGPFSHTDASVRTYWENVSRSIRKLEKERSVVGTQHRTVGRVLDDEKPEDRSVVFLASSSSNISIRWQQGRFIGAGSFGSVYLANSLDSGSLMAVKEIKFQELSGLPNLITQIKEELSVMEMLHHPNVVEYYGIEVHRDKVYIFEEYCSGGSLASLLEHGRIEDESVTQAYTMQMLEGLAYLHSKGIVHRDVKPDSESFKRISQTFITCDPADILLDHLGVVKFVDFGAAKILAQSQRSLQRTRRGATDVTAQTPGIPALGGLGTHNSLTGTPMYMSPEVIKNDKRGRHGAMDIWSLGCIVLEFATGKKPWSNLDNEWYMRDPLSIRRCWLTRLSRAIMFHIGVATQHPPLPEPGQMSERGIDFIQQCLTIDSTKRPSAVDLMDHAWMLEFREALFSYEEAEDASRQRDIATEEPYQSGNANT